MDANRMKTVGLIGGMSWESTIPYYQALNKGINHKLGKNHSAKCLIYSFDFQEIEELQYEGNWDRIHKEMIRAGTILKNGGADFALLCTNTMHKVMDNFEERTGLPLIHIADAVGESINKKSITTVGLLGTIFTMEEDFYRDILEKKYGLKVIIPEKDDRIKINDVIYSELVKGIIKEESRTTYYKIMDDMVEKGAQGIILGCTEIGLLIKEYKKELFDSTIIHGEKALEYIFTEKQ
jgi:aspartate racemase